MSSFGLRAQISLCISDEKGLVKTQRSALFKYDIMLPMSCLQSGRYTICFPEQYGRAANTAKICDLPYSIIPWIYNWVYPPWTFKMLTSFHTSEKDSQPIYAKEYELLRLNRSTGRWLQTNGNLNGMSSMFCGFECRSGSGSISFNLMFSKLTQISAISKRSRSLANLNYKCNKTLPSYGNLKSKWCFFVSSRLALGDLCHFPWDALKILLKWSDGANVLYCTHQMQQWAWIQ